MGQHQDDFLLLTITDHLSDNRNDPVYLEAIRVLKEDFSLQSTDVEFRQWKDGTTRVFLKRATHEYHLPEKCPFCGAETLGGSGMSVYYTCGAHVWIDEEMAPTLHGHTGTCLEGKQ